MYNFRFSRTSHRAQHTGHRELLLLWRGQRAAALGDCDNISGKLAFLPLCKTEEVSNPKEERFACIHCLKAFVPQQLTPHSLRLRQDTSSSQKPARKQSSSLQDVQKADRGERTGRDAPFIGVAPVTCDL